ncbi:hypothetical protein D3C78_1069000 [compost metagenome]
MLAYSANQLADHPLCIEQIDGMGNIHNLTSAVFAWALRGHRQYIGMLLHHPCGNRIGWRSDNDMNACLMHRVQHSIHGAEIKYAVLRLMRAPGRFCDPNGIDTGRLHHPDILV